jgi:hypothetical protein
MALIIKVPTQVQHPADTNFPSNAFDNAFSQAPIVNITAPITNTSNPTANMITCILYGLQVKVARAIIQLPAEKAHATGGQCHTVW